MVRYPTIHVYNQILAYFQSLQSFSETTIKRKGLNVIFDNYRNNSFKKKKKPLRNLTER